MKCTNHNRSCHAERVSRSPEPFASLKGALKGKLREGEASLRPSRETLSAAKGDNTVPISFGKVLHCGAFLEIEKALA